MDVDVDLPATDESPIALKIRSIRARHNLATSHTQTKLASDRAYPMLNPGCSLRERAAAHTAPPSRGERRRTCKESEM
eukprot:4494250-Amphidinium_carterae.1